MIDGKLVWLQEEDPNEDISIALIICEQLYTSVLLKGHSRSNLIDPTLQDNVVIGPWNIPLHLPRGMHIQSSFYYQQWIGTWRSKFEQKTDGVLLGLLIQEMKVTETLNILTSLYHGEHNTATVRGRNIKTRYFGSILILRSKKV